MRHTFMWYSEVEMLEKNLGLSLLSKHVKPGVLVLLVLWMNVSSGMHLRIYKGLNILLLDISVNTCPKGQMLYPKEMEEILSIHLKLNGEVWRGVSPDYFAEQPRDLIQLQIGAGFSPISLEEFKNYMKADLYGISKRGSSAYVETRLVDWSTDYTSSVVVSQFPHIPVGLLQYWMPALTNYPVSLVKNCKETLDNFLEAS